MNDKKRHFTITVDVDAKIKVLRARPRDVPRAVPIDIDLVLKGTGNPTPDFTLIDRSGLGVVADGPGPDQVIDLSKLPKKGRVKIKLKLVAAPDLHFSTDARQALGIQREVEGCPTRPVNDLKDQFVRRGISEDKKHVTLYDMNDDGGRYRFAVFVYKGDDPAPVASCDPRIINK
jgi:hypothetical protein